MITMFESVEANASWDLVKRHDVLDCSNVEVFQSVRSEILAHESAKLHQAVFQHIY